MPLIPKDVRLGVGILVGTAVLLYQTTLVRNLPSTRFGAEVWPRIVLVMIGVLAILLILRGLRHRNDALGASHEEGATPPVAFGGLTSRDVIAVAVFGSFGFFVYMTPLIGTPLAGFVMVMAILSFIGEPGLKSFLRHAAIASVAVGLMWIIFTFVLRVIMPTGNLW